MIAAFLGAGNGVGNFSCKAAHGTCIFFFCPELIFPGFFLPLRLSNTPASSSERILRGKHHLYFEAYGGNSGGQYIAWEDVLPWSFSL